MKRKKQETLVMQKTFKAPWMEQRNQPKGNTQYTKVSQAKGSYQKLEDNSLRS